MAVQKVTGNNRENDFTEKEGRKIEIGILFFLWAVGNTKKGRGWEGQEVTERIRKGGLGFAFLFFRPVKMLLGETEIKMIKE